MNFGECETPTCLMGTCVLSSAELEDEGVKVIHMMGWTHIQTPPLSEQEQVLTYYLHSLGQLQLIRLTGLYYQVDGRDVEMQVFDLISI